MTRTWFVMVAALVTAAPLGAQVFVRDSVEHRGAIAGTISLPVDGMWQVREPAGPAAISQVELVPPEELVALRTGHRMASAVRVRQDRRATRPLWMLRDELSRYATRHDGMGPASFDELLAEAGEGRSADLLRGVLAQGPELLQGQVAGPFYLLVPGVPVDGQQGVSLPARPVVLELRPWVDDGRHWVLLSNRRVERRAIDAALLDDHGVRVKPVPLPSSDADIPAEINYKIVGLRRLPADEPVRLDLHNPATGQALSASWDLSAPAAGGEETWKAWAAARARRWRLLASQAETPVLLTWLEHARKVDGAPVARPALNRRGNRQTSVLNVLGGRAAIRETLQMQVLEAAGGAPPQGPAVAISEIAGVEVQSHPFAEMLGPEEGGRLALAEAVPTDRLLVYCPRPGELLGLMDGAAGFLSGAGGAWTRSSISYDLVPRYLARLGLSRQVAEVVLNSGLIDELAVTSPDLFFIDGTDLTVIMRVPQLDAAAALLDRLGLVQLEEGRVVPVATTTGASAWWAARGDLLVAGTGRSEVDNVMALVDSGGSGSLGKSAEMRFMLTRLDVTDHTAAYVYFSDPFIRRLVGPEVKIGQLRRLEARARMEALAASALLYSADGRGRHPTLQRLREQGYLPEGFDGRGLELADDLVPVSQTWGSPARMATLLEVPVDSVSAAEAESYARYVAGYSRFWRQFFDPIAVRLDLKGESSAELTTFILPLLDSRLYDGLRQVLETADGGAPLLVPRMQPEPTLMLSLNLAEGAWIEVARSLQKLLVRYSSIDPVVLDSLGPGLHLAVMDADPVMSLGSGDVLGAFGGSVLAPRREMLAIPVLLSVLVRPCRLLVEVQDPAAVRAVLERAGPSPRPRSRDAWELQADIYRVAGRDAWVYTMRIPGAAALRFGIELAGDYLVISNLPWSQPAELGGGERQALNGAGLRVSPGSVEQELAALHTAAQDNRRAAAVRGIAYLEPLMQAGADSLEQAAAMHFRLFGFRPVHPDGGQWLVEDGEVVSSLFGSVEHPRQSPWAPGDREFGLLGRVDEATVNLQLEEGGLRTLVRWRGRDEGAAQQ